MREVPFEGRIRQLPPRRRPAPPSSASRTSASSAAAACGCARRSRASAPSTSPAAASTPWCCRPSRPGPERDHLRELRPVHPRLPHRRPAREVPPSSRSGTRSTIRQEVRGGPGGARHPRGAGRGVRPARGHRGHRPDRRGAAPAGVPAGLRHDFAADLTIMEEASELVAAHRARASRCPCSPPARPAWVKYVEHFYPELLPNISTCKSPQEMMGATGQELLRARRWASTRRKIFVVSVMPCTAKKYEAQRPEMAAPEGLARRGRRAHHPGARPDDPARRASTSDACRTRPSTSRWALPPAPGTSSAPPAA